MGGRPEEPLTAPPVRDRRGAALVVVLWALVALGALALAASVGAILDLRLGARHREHAGALTLAEAGVAEALATVTLDPARAFRPDSVSAIEGAGSWSARWTPAGARLRLDAEGRAGSATRRVEVWAEPVAAVWRIAAWRELR